MARLKEQYVNEIAPALNSKFGYKSVMQIPKLDKVVINVACGEAKDNEKILEAVMKDLGQITGQKAVVCRAKKSVANFKLRQGTPIGCKVTLRGERMYEFVDRFFNVAAGEAKENVKVIDAIVADLGQITGQKAVVCKAKKSVANFKLRQGMPIGAKVTLRGERMYEFVDRLFNVARPRVRDFRGINGNSFDGRGNYAFGLKEQIIFPEIDFDKVDAVRGMDICFVTTAKTDEEAKELLKALGAPFAN